MNGTSSHDAIIVGGGFYGCVLALHLRKSGARVLLLERSDRLLGRASWNNQARVHRGYHYPRDVVTALRSRVNYPQFVAQFSSCVDATCTMLYAVSRKQSKVTAGQFSNFCARIGAALRPAPPSARRLFNDELIEDVFLVEESVFDANLLREFLQVRLDATGVELRMEHEAETVHSIKDGALSVRWRCGNRHGEASAARVFNCTYSRINRLLDGSGLEMVPLKHELTEVALVQVPPELEDTAVTVMCGPFFSLLPFPTRGLHTLSHVRYTPHGEWHDRDDEDYRDPYARLESATKQSAFEHMVRDAERYLPALKHCRHVDSLWEVKTVLPRSEQNDGRPILVQEAAGLPGLVNVLGAKLDNCSDMIATVGDMNPGSGAHEM